MNEFKIDLHKNRQSKDNSIMGKVYDFQEEIEKHEMEGYDIYKKPPAISACDRVTQHLDRFTNQSKEMIMFGSNSYLGATNLKCAIDKKLEVAQEFGIGSGGVPLLSGTTIHQNLLEKEIAMTKGFEDTILFSSGFTANIGAITGLVGHKNLIIHDKLNHASLFDGTLMSGAKFLRYRHNDMYSLEKLLKDNQKQYPKGILVITDGVFSMDGDIANIPEIVALTQKYGAVLLIDDAHATGVIGDSGQGTLSHFNIIERQNIIVTGTLSKAIGTVGGFITASKEVIDYLRIFARSNMYSTSLPPDVCASALEVFKYMKSSSVINKLSHNYTFLREKLKNKGFNTLNTKTAIVPVVVGDEYKLTQMSRDIFNSNIFLNYIFPPVVLPKLSRLRLSIMASHTQDDLEYLIDILTKVESKYHFNQNSKIYL